MSNDEEEKLKAEDEQTINEELLRDFLSPQMTLGDSSIAISGSENVHFGHKVTVEDVNVKRINVGENASYLEKVEKVEKLDYHQHNNIQYKDLMQTFVHHQHHHIHLPSFINDTHQQVSRTLSVPINEKEINLVERVQEFLRIWYSTNESWIHPLPWCSDYKVYLANYYINLSLKQSTFQPIASQHNSLQMCNIFERYTSSVIPDTYRVLVEGNPGYGKSMLCLKLAYDWANKDIYMSGFNLVFLIPLRNFMGSLESYVTEEMYPKHEDPSRKAVLWRFICQQQNRVLFILDGYDELRDDYKGDIQDLLSGKLLPSVNYVVTSRPTGTDLLAMKSVRNIFQIDGFQDQHIRAYIRNFFLNSQYKNRNFELLSDDLCGRIIESSRLKSLASCPFICLLLCILYEDEGERLPEKVTDIYLCLVTSLARRASYRGVMAKQGNILDLDFQNKIFMNLGKSCFNNLVSNKLYFTSSEVDRDFGLKYMLEFGLLSKVKSVLIQRLRNEDTYELLHKTFMEFFAANYLKSIAEDVQVFQNEIQKMEANLKEDTLNLFQYLSGLLKDKAFLLFNLIGDSNLKPKQLFSLLEEAGHTAKNVMSVSAALNIRNLAITSDDSDLDGWSHILLQHNCDIEHLDFQYVVNHGNLLSFPLREKETSKDVIKFCSAVSANTSIKSFKFRSLIHSCDNLSLNTGIVRIHSLEDVCEALRQCLKNKSMTMVTIDIRCVDANTHEYTEPIPLAIAHSLSSTPDSIIEKLIISVPLGNREVESLSAALLNLVGLTTLHLCKLSCDRNGFIVLADYLTKMSLEELLLGLDFSKLGANQHDPGSPQDLKQSMSSMKKEIFRRISHGNNYADNQTTSQISRMASTSKLNNIVSLINNEVGFPDEKTSVHIRNGIWYLTRQITRPNDVSKRLPLPFCDQFSHTKSGFHHVFTKISHSSISSLDLTMCFLKPSDFACLGECLRENKTLQKLVIRDCRKVHDVFPILLSLHENASLKFIDLSSKTITLDGYLCELLFKVFSNNHCLRTLVLQGWTFNVGNTMTWSKVIHHFLRLSFEAIDLSASQIVLQTTEDMNGHLQENFFQENLKSVNLDSLIVRFGSEKTILSRVRMVEALRLFSNLTYLDISGSPEEFRSVYLTDTEVVNIFQIISKWLKTLTTIKICHWTLEIANEDKTCRALGECLKNMGKLVNVYMDYLKVNSNAKSNRKVNITFIKALKKLQTLSLIKHNLTVEDGAAIGLYLKDKWIAPHMTVFVKQNPVISVESLMKTIASNSKLQCSFVGGPRGEIVISSKSETPKTNITNPFKQFFMKSR